jgi:predicted nucleotidyltransferase
VFKLDIGIIGPTLKNKPSCIGGVEIEYKNRFDGRKALLLRSLGFPLFSVDISGMSLIDITQQWAKDIISKTTSTFEDGLRKTYIYLPTSLYPLYINPNENLYHAKDKRHQYLAFSKHETLKKLEKWLNFLRDVLGYSASDIDITIISDPNDNAKKQLENAGSIAGKDWKDYSDNYCLRVSLFRPKHDKDLFKSHLFLITMSRLFLEQDVLLGYKYALGDQHLDPAVHIWSLSEWNMEERKNTYHRLLPKRLATPVLPILKKIEIIKQSKDK